MPLAASLYAFAVGPSHPAPAVSPQPSPGDAVGDAHSVPPAAPPPNGTAPSAHAPSTPPLPNGSHHTQSDADRRAAKAAVVDAILAEHDLYRLLDVPPTASLDDIRRGFLLRSRVCHPDKFPENPLATVAFQRISLAYQTLSQPTSRRLYDITSRSDLAAAGSHTADAGGVQDETLNGVLHSILHEFLEGDFQMIRVLVQALSDAPGWELGEETVDQVEAVFQRLRTVVLSGQNLRQLSYLDIFGRLRLTLQLARVTLGIPMAIDAAMIRTDEPASLGPTEVGTPEPEPCLSDGGSEADQSEASEDEGPPTPQGTSNGFGIRPDPAQNARRRDTKDRIRARRRSSHARMAQRDRPTLQGHQHENAEQHPQPWGLLGPAGRGILRLLLTVLELTEKWIPGSRASSANGTN